jgi:hypothetical protein
MENELYFSEKFTKSAAWIDLLLLANHQKGTLFIRGNEINLEPGELCYSQLTLAERWKWNFKTVKSYLDLLTDRKMITYSGGKVTTKISIVNWGKYQKNGVRNRVDNKGVNAVLEGCNGEQNGEQMENRTEINNTVNNRDKNNRNSLNEFSIENLPLNLNGELFYQNDFFFITQTFKNELIEKLPANNLTNEILMTEFYKMENWLKVHGSKKNYRSFITNWLSKVKSPGNQTKQFNFKFNPVKR